MADLKRDSMPKCVEHVAALAKMHARLLATKFYARPDYGAMAADLVAELRNIGIQGDLSAHLWDWEHSTGFSAARVVVSDVIM